MSTSTFTPTALLSLPDKKALQDAFVDKPVSSLRTPALLIDRKKFQANCEKVTRAAQGRGMKFRAHIKTHKAVEGIRMQVEAGDGVRALIASTLPEVWQIVDSGLVEEGKVDDILYSMPISADRLEDLDSAQKKVPKGTIRLMVDHAVQIKAISEYNTRTGRKEQWSVFVKVDGGGRRAGVPPQSDQLKDLIAAVQKSSAVSIYGFYSHFGQSYASPSLEKATEYYHGEIDCVNTAAKVARGLGAKGDWVLSVGATPTAHAATQIQDGTLDLEGTLELHAGCYCMCDLQQFATSLIPIDEVAIAVLARVVSTYSLRSEAMCDAGALAVSKDTGPLPGYGHVVHPPNVKGWDLGRVSQEHGTLVHRPNYDGKISELKIGDEVRIVPQHACLVCASYSWFYIVEDEGDKVVDVWVPAKGW